MTVDHQFAESGYVRLGDPLAEMLPCRRVYVTVSKAWHGRCRVGLPRTADLDALAGRR